MQITLSNGTLLHTQLQRTVSKTCRHVRKGGPEVYNDMLKMYMLSSSKNRPASLASRNSLEMHISGPPQQTQCIKLFVVPFVYIFMFLLSSCGTYEPFYGNTQNQIHMYWDLNDQVLRTG